MALTIDWLSKIVHSDASITDIVAFHLALRDREDDVDGIIYDVIHTYKEIDLGSGAKFPAVAFINGWTLQFPAGNYEIRGGNVAATINPVAGCYVKQTQSAAYAATSIGAGGATPTDIATEVWSTALEGLTAEQMMRVILSALAGKRQGLGTATEEYLAQDGVTPRITLSPDGNGNGTPTINGAP